MRDQDVQLGERLNSIWILCCIYASGNDIIIFLFLTLYLVRSAMFSFLYFNLLSYGRKAKYIKKRYVYAHVLLFYNVYLYFTLFIVWTANNNLKHHRATGLLVWAHAQLNRVLMKNKKKKKNVSRNGQQKKMKTQSVLWKHSGACENTKKHRSSWMV